MDTNKDIHKPIKWNVIWRNRYNVVKGFLQIIFKLKKNRK